MTGADTIEIGRQAWAKIHRATSFESWKAVAVAVAIGRQQAMREAGANKPFGSKYSAAINRWLEANGFREMAYGVRTALCILADNLVAIDAWRHALPAKERATLNNPEVIVRSWRQATGIKAKSKHAHVVSSAKKTSYSRAVRWPQDFIRRARDAVAKLLKETRRGDGSTTIDIDALVNVVASNLVRDQNDLIDLIQSPEPPPRSAPRRSAEDSSPTRRRGRMTDLSARADRGGASACPS